MNAREEFIEETAAYLRQMAEVHGYQDYDRNYHPGACASEDKVERLDAAADALRGPLQALLKQTDKLVIDAAKERLPPEADQEVRRLREALVAAFASHYRIDEIVKRADLPTRRDPRRRNHYLHRSAIRLAVAQYQDTHPREVRQIAADCMERAGFELASETTVNNWLREERKAFAASALK